jgi:hypothetical protein
LKDKEEEGNDQVKNLKIVQDKLSPVSFCFKTGKLDAVLFQGSFFCNPPEPRLL